MEVLVPTHNGGQYERILWGSISGTVWRDPGGATLPYDIQHDGGFIHPELGLCGGVDGGRIRSRGFSQGYPEDGGILLCQRCTYHVHKGGEATTVVLHPGRVILLVGITHQHFKDHKYSMEAYSPRMMRKGRTHG